MKTDLHLEHARKRHHLALEALAQQVGCKTPGLTLWRSMRRLERKIALACEQYSNDSGFGIERWETVKDDARRELARIFGGSIPKGVFINGDPRGYMLKLDNDQVAVPEGMHTDWGNYGILAAEIE